MKTNAMRMLDTLNIHYTLRDYTVDPDDLSAESVALKVGMPAEQVFKTLVVRGDRTGIMLAVVPGNGQLNLKTLSHVSGNRSAQVVALKEVQPLTGYIRGGVTALACKKKYPVYVDETAELFDAIAVSAGVRGTQIIVHPADYIRAVEAVTAELTQ